MAIEDPGMESCEITLDTRSHLAFIGWMYSTLSCDVGLLSQSGGLCTLMEVF